MTIRWLGHAAFLLDDGKTRLVFDPYDPSVGPNMPKVQADIVVCSHQHHDHAYVQGLQGSPVVWDKPGPWEIDGVRGVSYPEFHDDCGGKKRGGSLITVVHMAGLRVCHMGDIGHVIPDELAGELRDMDVLLLPVGGFYTVDAAGAAAIWRKLHPKICVPMHYRYGAVTLPIAPVEDFLALCGGAERLPGDSFDPARHSGVLLPKA